LIQINTKKQMLMICKSETKMQCQTFGGAEYIIERSSLGKIKYAWLFDIGPLSIQFVSDPSHSMSLSVSPTNSDTI
jgi:hypothetical protein